VQERQYNVLGQLAATVAYGTRISTTGLAGGLVPAALTTAINAVKNAALDSKQSFTYYTSGTLASVTDALGNVTTDQYNAFGQVTSETSPITAGVTRTDTTGYDRRGLATAAAFDTTGINATTSAVYDAFGRLVSSLDANNNLRRQSFDRNGRLVQTIDPVNVARSTTFDAFDRVLTQTDGNLQVTRYAYTTSTRSVVMTTPEGITVTTVHTRHGQTYTIKDGKRPDDHLRLRPQRQPDHHDRAAVQDHAPGVRPRRQPDRDDRRARLQGRYPTTPPTGC
jgi:YD repeat-containing protein